MTGLSGDATLIKKLLAGDCSAPHDLLGAHNLEQDGKPGLVFRAYHPDAITADLILDGRRYPMTLSHRGIFSVFVAGAQHPVFYEIDFHFSNGDSLRRIDPYGFRPTLGEVDEYLTAEGRHYQLYRVMGAHPRVVSGVAGCSFAVWAPNARRVSIIGDFNRWDGRQHPMRQLGSSGIWELFIPGLGRGELYKFEIKSSHGELLLKSDPFAFYTELRPQTASVVNGLGSYAWRDQSWMEKRPRNSHRHAPMAIYEVHLGSWMRSPDRGHAWLNYRELADRLVPHLVDHGFTHLQLLPLEEHAYDPSWGYQVTGFFAPTSRYGSPDDLRYLVDLCHRHEIGVILDWVPGHFPKDAHGLARFDGTALYEHLDPRQGEHQDWGTLIFNYGRHEVRSFLISNALYWLDEFHFDGLRVDAVASMLYLDYSRDEGDWLPNAFGGRENVEAIHFLREMNTAVYANYPGVMTIAEESTAWPGVTLPVDHGGLGFGFKWNMGWMHDTLVYFQKDPIYRSYHHNQLTFGMLYAYTENYILPLSHDEVVHGKGSLWSKMPGDDWQRAANMRLLLAYLFAYPGKKLLFMGGEFGQRNEWTHEHSLDWHLCQQQEHAGIQLLVKDLGRFYRTRSALWEWDCLPQGFRWIDCNDGENSVVAFIRRGGNGHLVCVFNFTPVPRLGYRIGLPDGGEYREAINTDSHAYGGGNIGNLGLIRTEGVPYHGFEQSADLVLPPLAAVILDRN
jgi:1,4-alpha-glucan branching enzyme